MKKNICSKFTIIIAIGNLCFMSSEAKFSLWDFIKGTGPVQIAKEETFQDKPKIAEHTTEPISNNFDKTNSSHKKTTSIPNVMIQDKEQEIVKIPTNIPMPNNEPNGILIGSSTEIFSVDDLLKIINNNVEKLSQGRLSNRDNKKLQEQKNIVETLLLDFNTKLNSVYNKICILEKILISYNLICETSAYFLEDIDKSMIEQVQNTLFYMDIEAAKNELTLVFSTEVSAELKECIIKWTDKANKDAITNFCNWISTQLKKIPSDLLEDSQSEQIKNVLNSISQTISGNFKEKCYILKNIVDSYNAIKTIPFRLKKIDNQEITDLILNMIEHEFFDKILENLHVMSEANFSETAELDEEVLVARNIKKTTQLLSEDTTKNNQKSSLIIFKKSDSLFEKSNALKTIINQFNKTANLYNKLMEIKGINKNIDLIQEDIDRLMEKIKTHKSILPVEVNNQNDSQSHEINTSQNTELSGAEQEISNKENYIDNSNNDLSDIKNENFNIESDDLEIIEENPVISDMTSDNSLQIQ